jgi:hypothetical protein
MTHAHLLFEMCTVFVALQMDLPLPIIGPFINMYLFINGYGNVSRVFVTMRNLLRVCRVNAVQHSRFIPLLSVFCDLQADKNAPWNFAVRALQCHSCNNVECLPFAVHKFHCMN